MLPTLLSQLVTNSMEQNPYGEASQIPCFFMETEGSSPYSQKLTIYPCSVHDQLRPSPPLHVQYSSASNISTIHDIVSPTVLS